MKFEIKNRFTGSVQFTAEIDCADDATEGEKIGLAVIATVNAGAYLSDAYLRRADLRRADLRGAYLHGAYLHGADLSDTDLSGANLSGADLRRANLSGADLRRADLRRADLRRADLRGAYLRRADLRGAYLHGAYLHGADLSDTDLSGANLSGADAIHSGTRSDGFEFYAHVKNCELWIKAGCRYFNISDAREHWTKNRGGTPLGDESMALLDNAERLAKIRGML